MCWSLEVSMLAAVYGFGMSYYFAYVRRYTYRDPWYGLFLFSFTLTQLLDAYFWWRGESTTGQDDMLDEDNNNIPCDLENKLFTKIVVSFAVFFQVIAITMFPSETKRPWVNRLRGPYRILPIGGALAMAIVGKCTYATVTEGGWLRLPTLVYWGFLPTPELFFAGVALWSIAALLFITPWWAATNILLVGGINLALLRWIDGTILLVSKLCFYCLLLSILWLLEPLWCDPSPTTKTIPQCKTNRKNQTLENPLI